jgi:hypothetical protein
METAIPSPTAAPSSLRKAPEKTGWRRIEAVTSTSWISNLSKQHFQKPAARTSTPMKKTVKANIEVQGTVVNIVTQNEEDYICLTDIARFRNPDATDDLIRNRLRNRNTIEFLGIWEQLHNPGFNPVEFDGIKMQADLNSFALTPKQWNERTGAIEQLPVLANLESLNAEFIHMRLAQSDRIAKLNAIAIRQMRTLIANPAGLLETRSHDDGSEIS